jgi:tetratricopeptide (TPR) repeat protein
MDSGQMIKAGLKTGISTVSITTLFLIVLHGSLFTGCRPAKPSIAKTVQSKAVDRKNISSSVVQKLKEQVNLSIEERIALYYSLKSDSSDSYNFKDEDALTMYGYSFLWENKIKEAIAIFKLLVAEFPNSSNAHDSLAEAYFKNDEKELSLYHYTRSLALNPENFNAEDQIERIRFPGKVPDKPTVKFATVFSAKAYKDDLDQLGKTLLKVHPNAIKFITNEAFWNAVEAKKALVTDSTTYGEFAWYCSEIIANIHCSHSNMGSFDYEAAMLPLQKRFPVQVRWIRDQLFVVNPFTNDNKVKIKDEIVRINGIAVAEIVKDSYKHIPAQGFIETTKNHFFNTWCTAMIPYALDFPEKYEITIKGVDQSILLKQAETIHEPFVDRSIGFSRNNLSLKFIDNKIALLTVASFNYYRWNDFDVFKNFIDSSFKEISKRGVQALVIDVRSNPGGSQSAAMHLLQYLVNKPFTYFSNAQFEGKTEKIEGEDEVSPFENRFKGNCYFMIDGKGNSTTGHFMSIVRYLNLGTIVGEELGSNQFCSAGMTTRRLKNTKLEYYVANNTHESLAISLPDERGILPDHYITQSIDEYFEKTDAVREFTIKLIKKEK